MDLEPAKQEIIDKQSKIPRKIVRGIRSPSLRFSAATLRAARATMWAFEETGGLLLLPAIFALAV
jgi:hypothetical protein